MGDERFRQLLQALVDKPITNIQLSIFTERREKVNYLCRINLSNNWTQEK